MDNFPLDGSAGGGRPPRKELQGPRPTPLKVRKESHKIRKPPVAPPQQPQPPQQPRQPVIIYTVSPKVIHANPNEFMTLVQRLTGPDATSASGATSELSSSSSSSMAMTGHHYVSGAVSSFEMTKMPPGILSPGPSSLPPISPNLFSPFFNDPNYGINHNFNYNNNNNNNFNYNTNNSNSNITTNNNNSPFNSSNFISPGAAISPASLDLLHQILNS
ncbi:hypothetical protein vseg_017546 [Gypsophila vaccaria]